MNNSIDNARLGVNGTADAVLADVPVVANVARANPVPWNGQNPPSTRPPILTEEEASRRAVLLSALQSALAAQGVRSVLARHHRLVLGGGRTKCAPSGLTDPQLHVFTRDGKDIATTDGSTYHFASGHAHPADDPAQAARRFERRNGHQHAESR